MLGIGIPKTVAEMELVRVLRGNFLLYIFFPCLIVTVQLLQLLISLPLTQSDKPTSERLSRIVYDPPDSLQAWLYCYLTS